MDTVVFHIDAIEWVKHSSFPGVYIKDMLLENHHMGITNKYIKIEPMGEILPHTHTGTEAFFILQGKGQVLLHGEFVEMEAGHMVSVPGGCIHGIKNKGTEAVILLASFTTK